MRMIKRNALISVLLFMLGGCGEVEIGKPIPNAGVNEGLRIPAEDLPRMKGEAIDGSADAALKIASHYNYVEMNYDEAVYWFKIGAENGDYRAIFSLAVMLSVSDRESDRRRSLFWLKEAEKRGVEPYATYARNRLKMNNE